MSYAEGSSEGRPMHCQACSQRTFHLWDDPANFCMHCGSHAYIETCPHCDVGKLYSGHFCGNCGKAYSIPAMIVQSGCSGRVISEATRDAD